MGIYYYATFIKGYSYQLPQTMQISKFYWVPSWPWSHGS